MLSWEKLELNVFLPNKDDNANDPLIRQLIEPRPATALEHIFHGLSGGSSDGEAVLVSCPSIQSSDGQI